MSEMNPLRAVERRAWTLNFQDGLWDIFLGLLFLGGGLRGLTDSLWCYLLVAAGVLTFLVGKPYVTLPRIGRINFGPRRKARMSIVRVAVVAAFICTTAIFFMVVANQGVRSDYLGWFFVFLVTCVFLLMALLMDFNRLYGYTVLIAAFMVITEVYGRPMGDWAQILAGLVPLIIGAILFGRFLHRYPAGNREAVAESMNNGCS